MTPREFTTSVTAVLAIMTAISVLEASVPLFPRTAAHRQRTVANLGLTAIGFLVNWAFTSAAAVLALLQGPGLLARTDLPVAAQVVVSIVALDFFFGYLAHVGLHFVPSLWRVHAVHHSDPFVDVTTTYRTHPIEVVWRSLFMLVPVWILGVPAVALVTYRLLSAFNALLEHANLRVWPALDRAISFVWVTPNMHKIHHSRERSETNSNYGNLLSVHDRLFRTFTDTRRAASVEYGLDGTDATAIRSLTGLLSLRLRSRRPPTTSIWLLVSSIAVGQAIVPREAAAQDVRPQPSPGAPRKAPTVLFLCPHGAAKSVLASAYFQREAKARGLDVRVEAAGTEPQDAISPVVAKHLEQEGYPLPVTKPRAVTKEDLKEADVVISMGCDVTRLPGAPRSLRTWDDVPAPSEGLKAADDAIRRRVIALVEELLAKERK